MPWVRIDEHALNHVKILALSHGAFRLWVEGLAHCQKHLTDGLISQAALRGFRYVRSAWVAELTRQVDGMAALWLASEQGWHVHDYLQWNDTKAKVLSDRKQAKDRMDRLRGRAPCSPEQHTEQVTERTENERCTTTTSTTTDGGFTDPKPPSPLDGFDEFWRVYPRHEARKKAEKAWISIKRRPPLAEIVAAVRVHSRSIAWRKDGGQFIPHAATWLNGRRWEDEAIEEDEPLPLEPVEGWFDECRRLHNRTCNGRVAHDTQMYLDAERAKKVLA
jgi:hypothetical protein